MESQTVTVRGGVGGSQVEISDLGAVANEDNMPV